VRAKLKKPKAEPERGRGDPNETTFGLTGTQIEREDYEAKGNPKPGSFG